MLVLSYAKKLHHIFIPTIYENFKSVLLTYLGQTWFEQLKELK